MKKAARTPAATTAARKRAPKKAISLDKAYKNMYHAFFLKTHENAPAAVLNIARKGDTSVEFMPWKVFIAAGDSAGLTDPLKTVSSEIVNLLLAIHDRTAAAFAAATRDADYIAQLAKITQPDCEFLKPCDEDDAVDFIYATLRAPENGVLSLADARTAAAAIIRIVKRLARAHANCILVCHKMPKSYVTSLCFAAGLPLAITELTYAAPDEVAPAPAAAAKPPAAKKAPAKKAPAAPAPKVDEPEPEDEAELEADAADASDAEGAPSSDEGSDAPADDDDADAL